jgi:hypothetical protein
MKNLDWLEWEPVTTPLSFTITQHGAFPQQITTVELSRNSELNLVAVGRGTGSFLSSEPVNLRAGELLPDVEDTIGSTQFGHTVRLRGVNVIDKEQIEDQNLLVQAQIDEAEVSQSKLPTITQIEWIVNFSSHNYILPQLTIRERYVFFKKIRSNGNLPEGNLNINEISSPPSRRSESDHFRCECTISNQNYSLIVGYIINEITDPKYKPGFLEFENLNNSCLPSEEVKQIILASLSFALGRQLASVGSTSLSENNDRITLISRGINSLVLAEKFYEQPSQPPTPLFLVKDKKLLDEEKISKIISSVGAKMDIIEHSLWLIWIGLISPLTVRASFFGAAIESLRDSCYSSQESKLSASLIPKSIWEKIYNEQLKCEIFDKFDANLNALNEDDKINVDSNNFEKLKKKIEYLNDKSSNMKYPDFYDSLNLKTGDVEKKAIDERNKSAHGKRYQSSDYYRLPMKMNALYTLYNRLVLKITGASDCYIDYSAYGYPVRHIDEPLGGLEGDGKWIK